MSDPTLPPKPSTAEIHAVAGPTWLRKEVLLNALSALTGLPALVSMLAVIPDFHLPGKVAAWMLVVAACAKWLATQFGSQEAGDAAARASRMGPGDLP